LLGFGGRGGGGFGGLGGSMGNNPFNSFDHLVGAREQRGWNFNVERPRDVALVPPEEHQCAPSLARPGFG